MQLRKIKKKKKKKKRGALIAVLKGLFLQMNINSNLHLHGCVKVSSKLSQPFHHNGSCSLWPASRVDTGLIVMSHGGRDAHR